MTTGAGNMRWWPTTAMLLSLATALAAEPLPDPLTLEDALRLAGADHPAIALSRARLAQLQADAERTAARDEVDIGASLEALLIRQPE
jgi:hypothetical protein